MAKRARKVPDGADEPPKKRGPKARPAPDGPAGSLPVPHDFLDDEAIEHWVEITALIDSAGALAALDRDALSIYCMLWSRWRKAERELARPNAAGVADGEVITAPNGYRQANPWYTIATACLKDMKPFLEMFGLNPRARSKLKIGHQPDDDGGKWDGLL